MNVNVMSTFDLTVSSKLDLAQVRTVLNASLHREAEQSIWLKHRQGST